MCTRCKRPVCWQGRFYTCCCPQRFVATAAVPTSETPSKREANCTHNFHSWCALPAPCTGYSLLNFIVFLTFTALARRHSMEEYRIKFHSGKKPTSNMERRSIDRDCRRSTALAFDTFTPLVFLTLANQSLQCLRWKLVKRNGVWHRATYSMRTTHSKRWVSVNRAHVSDFKSPSKRNINMTRANKPCDNGDWSASASGRRGLSQPAGNTAAVSQSAAFSCASKLRKLEPNYNNRGSSYANELETVAKQASQSTMQMDCIRLCHTIAAEE